MKKWIITAAATALLLSGCGANTEKNSPANTATEAPGTPVNNGKEETAVAKYEVDQISQALIDGDYEGVYSQLNPDFQKQMSLEDFVKTAPTLLKGVESFTQESTMTLNGAIYAAWMNQDRSKGLKVLADENKVLNLLQVVPLQHFPDTDSTKTKLTYELPFKGEWYVFWGGENVLANYHYEYEQQRYAYDLIQVKDGYSYSGDSTKNESYYAFGQEIFAPRAGTVVRVVNDIEDNEPVGKMNPEHPEGNVVVIDHGDGEYSFLAHMKKDSVVVKVGDKVEEGDLLGLCGNSGNTSEPHIHFQVSDTDDMFDGKSINVSWANGLSPKQGETMK
ncbi:peptidoglycan DD-metalloendopeptidase family protein [Paenibacillus sp. NPDC058071]|uniref:peptidoglycan DD-metalloendopeptidase family protein n=1 Tax=Paenibacillus sp. NPDC058071 TaxID=3346326 RepID=UPI0036DBACE1